MSEKKNSVQYLYISANHAQQRIDNYLIKMLKGVARPHIYRVLRRGEVRVNSGRIKPSYRLQTGDKLRIPPGLYSPIPPKNLVIKWQSTLEQRILYEDPGLLVINKPAHVPVHGGTGLHYGLIQALRQLRPKQDYLELVHRLDRGTSGCLLVAKKPAVLRQLHQQWQAGKVRKHYLALVQGTWPQALRHVQLPLLKHHDAATGRRHMRVDAAGKSAKSIFKPITHFQQATLVDVAPVTGRMHQIRVHAAASGHPIAGDTHYGQHDFNNQLSALGLRRLFLHAASLEFTLPHTGKDFQATVPLEDELQRLLQQLTP